MSLVGPRPALPHEVAEFDEELRGRQRVLPGITGLWQVEGRENPAFDVYRRLDLFYVENWSVGFDLAILLATAPERAAALRLELEELERRGHQARALARDRLAGGTQTLGSPGSRLSDFGPRWSQQDHGAVASRSPHADLGSLRIWRPLSVTKPTF